MITDNLSAITSRYDAHSPTLIAVSKKQPDDKIDEALSAGLRVFGENRVQEAMERWGHRRAIYPDLKLHLIGPLQTNKVKAACDLFDCIHTIDRPKLARSVSKYAPDMPCFIQVNTGAEPQKSGVLLHELHDFYHDCVNDLCMNIIGLMCIPPADDDPAIHFKLLQDRAKILGLKNLSMGMSSDFDIALNHGATHIRVGSALFGNRF